MAIAPIKFTDNFLHEVSRIEKLIDEELTRKINNEIGYRGRMLTVIITEGLTSDIVAELKSRYVRTGWADLTHGDIKGGTCLYLKF